MKNKNSLAIALGLGSLALFTQSHASPIHGILLEGTNYSGKTTITTALTPELKKRGHHVRLGKSFLTDLPVVQFLGKEAHDTTLVERGSWFFASGMLLDLALFKPDSSVFYLQDRGWLSHEMRLKYFHPETHFMPDGLISSLHSPFECNIYLTVDLETRMFRYANRTQRSTLNEYLLENPAILQEFDLLNIAHIPSTEKWSIIDTSKRSVEEIVAEILTFCEL